MNRESTLRAIEGMSLPGPRKTTPRAVLGSVPRIDFGNYALSLEKCLSEKDYNRLGDKSRRNPRSDIKKEKLVRGTGFEPANACATGPSTLLL